ncbi:MAG: bifunctional hydroxymethylpyrimidine kinase/phosphomethylpyrimidine kinase [Caldilineaceae bacterium]|nr:bifunctional hydroxymethylpyrimidine kinase/phosphomethylpyrimidine kinase [Caldilineaceae bacterium]
MVGRVGDDIFGQDMRRNLAAEGIDARFVFESAGVSSGVAVITVDDNGQNTIIVIAGANGLVTPDDVAAAQAAIAGARVLLCQMEVPMAANLAALRLARAAGVTTIFNSAPVSGEVPAEVYQLADIFCPNETEAELLTGIEVHTLDDARLAASIILDRGARAALITLGARGCLYVSADGADEVIPTVEVNAVDTTGAGDAFVGSLGYFLAAGVALGTAIERANAIAAISVQSPGTQSSYPRREQLPPELLVL